MRLRFATVGFQTFRPRENMVGVNMVLAESVKFKHGLYKSCGIECFEGIMLEPCLLQPCFHVAGSPGRDMYLRAWSRGDNCGHGHVYIHIYLYLSLSLSIYIYIYIYIHVFTSPYMCLSLSLYIYIYIYIYMYITMFSRRRTLTRNFCLAPVRLHGASSIL